jgi:hypothetical protein
MTTGPRTIEQRLQSVLGNLEGLAEDAATAADDEGLHPEIPDKVQEAFDAIEAAIELI